MLAALYQPGNQRLVLDRNYPIRELEDNEILIKIAATGGLIRTIFAYALSIHPPPSVCHSDVELLTGVSLDARKYVFGHESCGYPVK
jgi:propanol-preferring alcohol dehydrogenase